MDHNSNLTNAQIQAAAALASGFTATKAAQLAGVDRSTLYKWRNSNPAFRQAYCDARTEAIAEELDKLTELSAIALDQLNHLMTSPDSPPSVRLKACLAVLTRLNNTTEQGWAVAHASSESEHRERDRIYLAAQHRAFEQGGPELPAKSLADPEPSDSPKFNTEIYFPRPEPIRVAKTGRNESCPCGSGIKFKKCCLNKPQQAAA